MGTSNNPFWLEVKKEYVRDNFDSLVEYLKRCSSDSIKYQDDNDESSDFNRTFKAVQEAARDSISVLINGKKLGETAKSSWEDVSLETRIVASYLLACQITRKTDYEILAKFADYFVLAGFATTNELLMKLRKIVLCCAVKSDIETYGFSWKNIQEWNNCTGETFCNQLGNTNFSECTTTGYYEGKGMLICTDNAITILPLNKQQYNENKNLNKLSTQFSQEASLLTIDVTKDKRRALSSYEEIEKIGQELVLQQTYAKPSEKVKLKNYNEEDELIVKVVDYYQYGFVAESVDGSFNKVSGKVYIDIKPWKKYEIGYEDFKHYIRISDYITVTKQNNENIPFKLSENVFSEYYKWIVDNSDGIIDAIYKGNYSRGHQWVTIEGVLVNVYGTGVDDSIQRAIDDYLPITLKIQETKIDKSGNFIVNGMYNDEPSDLSKEGYFEQRKKNLLEGFVDYSFEDLPVQKDSDDDMRLFDKEFVTILSHIYYSLSQKCVSARNRCVQIIAAYMLSIMTESEYSKIVKFEMGYLSNLVRFAKGDTPSVVKIDSNDILLTNDEIKSKNDIIELLRRYSTKDNTYSELVKSQMTKDEKYHYLKRLVHASNILIGTTSMSEINRIKKSIAIFLGVEEEYKNILPDLTYYGEESDTLEFKTSVVFPPNSKIAEPRVQIWAILKTICGFMNTLSGGELLLGVDDNGYSKGLDDDILYLYENKKIGGANIDRYRDYLKRQVDHAFIDDSGVSKELNITSGRINYLIEKNKEGHTILRIQVRPYEYGNILFNPLQERPEGIAQSYYRTSGATVPMDDELKRKAKERKMNASYDGNLLKFVLLQQACNEKKRVILVNYTSHSETRDRYVEPYKALPEHDAFLFYDIDKKEIREYKLSRIESVKILDEKWLCENKHKPNIRIDIFGMIESPSSKPYEVELKLNPLAYNLLKEEYKRAEKDIFDNKDTTDNKEYPKVLKTVVCKNEGVGRFYIGLANSIKIVSGDKLREYVHEYKEKYLTI